MTVDTEALIAAVRAGDIEAAQALLPVDPIVKLAREICGRHFGNPAMYLRGECDDGPQMGAVSEALREPIGPQRILQAARVTCYALSSKRHALGGFDTSGFLAGTHDHTTAMREAVQAIEAALA